MSSTEADGVQSQKDDIVAGTTTPSDNKAIIDPKQPPPLTSNLSQPEITDGNDAAQLGDLAAGIRDQDDLERDIGRQADRLLIEQADERDKKRLEKTEKDRERLVTQARKIEQKLTEFGNHTTKTKLRAELEELNQKIDELDHDVVQIQKRVSERHEDKETAVQDVTNKRMAGESQREFLIRTGKITPFSKLGRQLLRTSSSLGDVLLDAEDEEDSEVTEQENVDSAPKSHRDLRAPGFAEDEVVNASSHSHRNLRAPGFEQETPDTDQDAELARKLQEEFASERPAKRRRLRARQESQQPEEEYKPVEQESSDEDSVQEDLTLDTTPIKKRRRRGKTETTFDEDGEREDLTGIDDGNENVYRSRLRNWVKRRRNARQKFRDQQLAEGVITDEGPVSDDDAEWHLPHPTRTDAEFEGGFRIPGDIYPSLFDYQKTGVQWLWELYSQQVGGIIGDEMGLGKTIQVISFLAGLHYSKKLTKPVVVVCPATVMQQWVNEFHRWWPPLRVSILHTSGSGMLDLGREARIEDDMEDDSFTRRSTVSKGHSAASKIVDRVLQDGHVLVTTYSGLQTYAELLIPIDWEYAVLDEGHKIRNPNTSITIYCKELRTHNRLILSGTPIQNNLTELWSLFDFIFPMRLGTLVNFRNQFELPIKTGGYANASNLQVETAMKCAETLKDTISPYLLQRFKVDVAADLPKKTERVLFCKLTKLQRDTYETFLASEEMSSIMSGKRQALYGVDILRKICNHPDLVEHKKLSKKFGYGNGAKSGKMQVVKALLDIWKRNGHKTLLFAQHRIMLDILEKFVAEDFNYRRMDGNTSIKDRQDLVDEFNRDPNLHLFLLTTKVGGLGVNLTGADRVIIYDPDWNPSTDVQARERAWRLGQKREVEIYRLMTAGTIEEKIYHRQIFKQFLTNKILRDPKQRQTFQLKDLHDLFTLGDDTKDGSTETGNIFKGTEVQLSQQSIPTPPAEGKNVDAINGVSRLEDFQGEEEEKTDKDDRVLSSIFARAGVQSALEHDAIVNGKKVITADPEIIAKEAKRVAAKAALELKRAGEIAKTVPAGVPTWTGQVGTSGRPEERPSRGRGGGMSGRGGRPSSAAVLANLSSRQGLAESSGRGQPKGKDFLVMIRDFLIAQGGRAYTQMLIDHFNRYCGTPQRTAEFKEMLKTIAVLDKGSRGRGSWVLKDEYRSDP